MRVYKRKSERATHSQEVYELAAAEVLEKKCSMPKASQTLGLCHVSLYRYTKKKKNNERLRVCYVKPRQVFTAEEEGKIATYLLKCADIYFGLLPIEVRKLAYQCGMQLNAKNIPPSWHQNNMAGTDWFKDDKINENGKGKGKGKGKSTKNKTGVDRAKRKVLRSDSEFESEEWFCLVCSETYTDSNKEDWVECIICKMWAHVVCVTGDTISFICINCSSDED